MLTLLMAGALGLLMAATALAQPAPVPAKAAPKRGPQKVIEMDPLEVIGKVQKPHVIYMIQRGTLKYEGLPLERSLLKEVEQSVDKPPF